jgi:hypothetical protein
VGADPLLFPVVDRAQVDDLLHVAPAALDFQELLVAEGDVPGGHLRVGGAQEVLAVEVLLGLRRPGIDAEQSAGGDPQAAFRPGFVEITPRSSARLSLPSLPVPSMSSLSWAIMRARAAASRSAPSGLWQMTNRSSSAIRTS